MTIIWTWLQFRINNFSSYVNKTSHEQKAKTHQLTFYRDFPIPQSHVLLRHIKQQLSRKSIWFNQGHRGSNSHVDTLHSTAFSVSYQCKVAFNQFEIKTAQLCNKLIKKTSRWISRSCSGFSTNSGPTMWSRRWNSELFVCLRGVIDDMFSMLLDIHEVNLRLIRRSRSRVKLSLCHFQVFRISLSVFYQQITFSMIFILYLSNFHF